MGERRGMLSPLPLEGRATFLPFRDSLPGSVMNEREWAVPGMLAGMWNAFLAPERARQGMLDPSSVEAMMEAFDVAGAAMLPGLGRVVAGARPRPGMLGANVWHGSPHKFDAFDASKIGTGEGAQAYGHGLYLADSPAVAGSYTSFGNWGARAAGRTPPTLFKGEPVQFSQMGNAVGDFEPALGRFLTRVNTKGTYDLAIKEAESTLAEMAARKIFPSEQRALAAEIAAAKANKADIQGSGAVGNLYKVDLPDEMIGKMLDWDKPLSQQPESVRKVLDQIKAASGKSPRFFDPFAGREMNGMQLIRALGDDETASRILREHGIPGIRYLDQGSRTSGKGTYNYVVFPGEEKALKILGRE